MPRERGQQPPEPARNARDHKSKSRRSGLNRQIILIALPDLRVAEDAMSCLPSTTRVERRRL